MLDALSYLLGKKAGESGGGGDEPQIVINEAYTDQSTPRYYIGAASQFFEKLDVEITIEDWRYLFYNFNKLKEIKIRSDVKPTGTQAMFRNCEALTNVPLFDTSEVTTFFYMFAQCYKIQEIPAFDTRNVESFQSAFSNCKALTTFPQLDASGVTSENGFSNMFQGSTALSDESLNNILATLASATNYTGTKTLAAVGISTGSGSAYTAEQIQGLSNYQAFIDAGWTIS